jgi:hypothetical protein
MFGFPSFPHFYCILNSVSIGCTDRFHDFGRNARTAEYHLAGAPPLVYNTEAADVAGEGSALLSHTVAIFILSRFHERIASIPAVPRYILESQARPAIHPEASGFAALGSPHRRGHASWRLGQATGGRKCFEPE